jgi:hypothetical protein
MDYLPVKEIFIWMSHAKLPVCQLWQLFMGQISRFGYDE